jgi:hypothetical protein
MRRNPQCTVPRDVFCDRVAANPGRRSQTLRRILIFDDDAATLALLSDLDVVAPGAKIGSYIFALALVTAVILGMFWPLL